MLIKLNNNVLNKCITIILILAALLSIHARDVANVLSSSSPNHLLTDLCIDKG